MQSKKEGNMQFLKRRNMHWKSQKCNGGKPVFFRASPKFIWQPEAISLNCNRMKYCVASSPLSSFCCHRQIKYDDPMSSWQHIIVIIIVVGWFLLRKFQNFQLCMFPHCSHCFTGFRTHLVFSVAELLPMVVVFFWKSLFTCCQCCHFARGMDG